MLVIKGQFNTTGPTGFTLDTDYIIPAETCSWLPATWNDTNKKYSISGALYVQGTASFAIVGAKLGFINKSGSFNEIA